MAAPSGNRNIAFNGERLQAAVERYRTGTRHPAGQRHHQLGAPTRQAQQQAQSTRTRQAPSAPTGGAGQQRDQ